MPLGGQFQPGDDRCRRVVSTHGIHGQYLSPAHCIPLRTVSVAGVVNMQWLDANDTLGGLARGDDFTIIVMAAMAAHMVRALQLTAIGAFRMCFGAQRLVSTAHTAARRRSFTFRNGHGCETP